MTETSYRITFQVSEDLEYADLKRADALHEILCKAIHEQDQKCLDLLRQHVTDIDVHS